MTSVQIFKCLICGKCIKSRWYVIGVNNIGFSSEVLIENVSFLKRIIDNFPIFNDWRNDIAL